MKAKGIMLLTTLGAALGAVPNLVRAQQTAVDQQVQEAKALYRDGSFAEAIAKLQDAITRLQLLRDIEAKKLQLAEAYLHLSLSHFALDNRAAAKETLKGLVRVDRERRLDPQIYAPPVIALFEEATAEVLLERVTANAPPGVRPSPSAAPKKGGSKAPLIVLGAAAAGGESRWQPKVVRVARHRARHPALRPRRRHRHRRQVPQAHAISSSWGSARPLVRRSP